MVGYIYMHTSPSGKSYIGQTYNVKGYELRWRNGYGYDKRTIFRRAIDKYGWSNISHDILHTVERDDKNVLLEELNRLEELEIINRNTIVPGGYNAISGGNNSIISELARENMSASSIKRYLNGEVAWNKGLPRELQPRFGKKQTSNQKDAARNAMLESRRLGKITGHKIGEFKHSEETKKKISQVQKLYSDDKKKLMYAKRNETMLNRYGKKSIGAKNTLGKMWFTDGIDSILSDARPSGYHRGRTIPDNVRAKISDTLKKRDRTDFILDKKPKKD